MSLFSDDYGQSTPLPTPPTAGVPQQNGQYPPAQRSLYDGQPAYQSAANYQVSDPRDLGAQGLGPMAGMIPASLGLRIGTRLLDGLIGAILTAVMAPGWALIGLYSTGTEPDPWLWQILQFYSPAVTIITSAFWVWWLFFSLLAIFGKSSRLSGWLLGVQYRDVQTGRPAGGRLFLKFLLQYLIATITAGLVELIICLATVKPPLNRNWFDRTTGLALINIRATPRQQRQPLPMPLQGAQPSGPVTVQVPPTPLPLQAPPVVPVAAPQQPGVQQPGPQQPVPRSAPQPQSTLIAPVSSAQVNSGFVDATPFGRKPDAPVSSGPSASGPASNQSKKSHIASSKPVVRRSSAAESKPQKPIQPPPNEPDPILPEPVEPAPAEQSQSQQPDADDHTVLSDDPELLAAANQAGPTPAAEPGPATEPTRQLRLADGTLLQPPLVIGRHPAKHPNHPEAKLRPLNDPQLSKSHLLLLPAEDGIQVQDLHSSNGVQIGDERITPGEPQLATAGTTIAFGGQTGEVVAE